MQKIKGKNINLKLHQDTFAELDRIASRLNMTRTEVIRSLLGLGIDVFHKYEAVGIVKLIEIKNRTRKTIQEDVTPSLF